MWKIGAVLLAGLILVGALVGKQDDRLEPQDVVSDSPVVVKVPSVDVDGDFRDEDGWCAVLRQLDGYVRTFPVKRGESVTVDSGVDILVGLNAAGLAGSGRQVACEAAVQSYMDDHQPWVKLINGE